LLNEVGSLFGILKYVCDIVVKMFTFAISSPYEFLLTLYYYSKGAIWPRLCWKRR